MPDNHDRHSFDAIPRNIDVAQCVGHEARSEVVGVAAATAHPLANLGILRPIREAGEATPRLQLTNVRTRIRAGCLFHAVVPGDGDVATFEPL